MLLVGFCRVKGRQGGHSVTRVVVLRNRLETDGGAVVEGDVSEVAVGHLNFLHRVEMRNIISHVKRHFVVFHVAVRTHRFVVVVEGDTG